VVNVYEVYSCIVGGYMVVVKCAKCGKRISKRDLKELNYSLGQTVICEECKFHSNFVINFYKSCKNIFKTKPFQEIPESDEYTVLRDTFFVIQENPHVKVYFKIIEFLVEHFSMTSENYIIYEDLWNGIRTYRDVKPILTFMQKAEIIEMKVKDIEGKTERVIEKGPILETFLSLYYSTRGEEHHKKRIIAVLAMYSLLEGLKEIAETNSGDIIAELFQYVPKALWITTMFLWSLRFDIKTGKLLETFTEKDLLKFLSSRSAHHLKPTLIKALKYLKAESVHAYIGDLEYSDTGDITFIVRKDVINSLERLRERWRERGRDITK